MQNKRKACILYGSHQQLPNFTMRLLSASQASVIQIFPILLTVCILARVSVVHSQVMIHRHNSLWYDAPCNANNNCINQTFITGQVLPISFNAAILWRICCHCTDDILQMTKVRLRELNHMHKVAQWRVGRAEMPKPMLRPFHQPARLHVKGHLQWKPNLNNYWWFLPNMTGIPQL